MRLAGRLADSRLSSDSGSGDLAAGPWSLVECSLRVGKLQCQCHGVRILVGVRIMMPGPPTVIPELQRSRVSHGHWQSLVEHRDEAPEPDSEARGGARRTGEQRGRRQWRGAGSTWRKQLVTKWST
eukprot:2912892-Rhodomonas_salina.1